MQPSYQIPILGNPSTSEDPKIHDALSQIETILTGNVGADNLVDGAVTSGKIGTTPVGEVIANAQNLANNTTMFLVFATMGETTDNMVNLGVNNDRITVQTNGVYMIEAQVRYVFHADSARRVSTILHTRSGAGIRTRQDSRVNVGTAGGGGDTVVSFGLISGALTGDIFQLQAYQDSGVTVSIDGSLFAARIGSL